MEVIEALQHFEKEMKINSSDADDNVKRQKANMRKVKRKTSVTRDSSNGAQIENEENEVDYASKWSTICRRERYKIR